LVPALFVFSVIYTICEIISRGSQPRAAQRVLAFDFWELAMIQLVYVSSAVKPFTDQELLGLLEKARENNQKLGITGMLLYKNGDFMQALEGDEQVVLSLADHIAKDLRHGDIRVI